MTYEKKRDPKPVHPDRAGRQCRRAKGAFTDVEGRFLLKRENVGDLQPIEISVIKEAYEINGASLFEGKAQAGRDSKEFTFEMHARQYSAEYGLHTIDQDSRMSHPLDCWRASWRDEGAAAVPYLEILAGEVLKYDHANEGERARWIVREILWEIHLLESLPVRPANGP